MPAVGEQRHAGGRAGHVLLKQQRSAAARLASNRHSAPQLARAASETDALATCAPPRLDHHGIADLARGPRPIRARSERARRRVRYADAGKATRQSSLVGGPPDRVRTGAEQRRPLPLGLRGEALEAAIRLRRDQPDGIGGRHQPLEQRLGRLVCGRKRHDLAAWRHRVGKASVRRRDDLMAADRREIGDERSPHRGRFTAERGRHVSPGEPPTADELVDENAHLTSPSDADENDVCRACRRNSRP